MSRRAGILLHPTSLPGPHGIGDVGPASRRWLEWLEAGGQRVWQVLPLTPVDALGCPYAAPSAFAHEPLLLSPADLVTDGWLLPGEEPRVPGRVDRIDWDAVRAVKGPALRAAAARVAASVDLGAWAADQPELATWALYRAIEEEQGAIWPEWPLALRDRDPGALDAARDRLAPAIARELALQWLFDQQWGRLRADARARDVELWGDVPFFVSWICADTWERPDRWRLGPDRRPTVVSGVPPDVFSVDGQLWGHPQYDEGVHLAEGHRWWVARFRRALSTVDRVRIDHFRGIEGVWEVPAGDAHARGGRWIPGPGRALLERLRATFARDGALPFVAEDLGVITEPVRALRDDFGLPGMVILQFAFNGDATAPGRDRHPYLPHEHHRAQVCYSGTHDNDTVPGWYRGTDDATREHLRRYLGVTDHDLPWALFRAAWRSVCDAAIVPLPDLLDFGSEARTNVPGRTEGNWSWRMPDGALRPALAARLHEEARLSGRTG